MAKQDHARWAEETFGEAELGDSRRVARLVSVAAAVAERPAGTVPQVFRASSEREGAFRLLENDAVSPEAIKRASFDASSRACRELSRIYVPVDGSSLTLTDRALRRELGRVGNTRVKSRGLQVMSALAVDEQGAAIGLLDQRWWARDMKPKSRRGNDRKCFGKRYLKTETHHWLQVLSNCDDRLHENAPNSRPWYQLDRGADCWPIFELALERDLLFTIRASHDRRLVGPQGQKLHLRRELRRQRIVGHYEVLIPRRGRPPRTARITLRACRVTVVARTGSKRWQEFTLNAVLAEETARRGKDRLCWILLTTHSIASRENVRAVVHGYTLRWRIEDFHRTWKRGLCNVEKNQLHSRNAIIKWATILGTVAARALRLAHLFRTASPDIPASTEFTEHEIEACYILAKKKRDRRKSVLLRDLLALIADLGGFAKKYSGKPPGPTVLGRGLQDIELLAKALQNMEEMR